MSNPGGENENFITPGVSAPPTVIHRGAKFSVELVPVRGADGVERRREVIRHPGAVVILPILSEAGGGNPARIVLIRNHRISLGRAIWELPAGTLKAGEDPAVCAGRELEEETGFRAATIVPLTRFYTTPGMTDELMWAYRAMGLTYVGARPEPDERMTVHAVDVPEALEMIGRGELVDGKSILTLLLAERQGLFGTGGR